MLSVRPMDSFRTAGRNTGPGAVIGQAIRGILDQARKKGLIEAQTGGNLMSSLGATAYKQQAEQDYDSQVVTTKIINPNTGKVTPVEHPRGTPPKTGGGQPNIYNFLDPNQIPGGGQPDQPVLSDEEAYQIYLRQTQGQ